MPRSRKRSAGARKRRSKRRSRAPSVWLRAPAWMRRLAAGVLALAFAAGFWCSAQVLALDRTVRERFEGVQFRVPSRVYSAPEILYPGLDWQRMDLRGTLRRLGYREARESRDLPAGQYVWNPRRLRVHLRAFEHPTRPEPSRDVVLRLSGSEIRDIRGLPSGEEVGVVLLEPEPVGAYYGPAREQRELVELEELPKHVVDAVLAVEDQRFASHPGIDLQRVAGALVANLRAGSIRQGGSTLTQQLVKNFFLTPERTLNRKLREAVMALIVEARYDKRQILESYLNEIYFGQRGPTAIHGVGEAARLYFGKPAASLSVAEAGLLAAIIQSPNGISPFREPERATRRRDLVLDLMLEQGRIGNAEHAAARDEPLRLASLSPESSDDRYFLDLLERQLADGYSGEALSEEGLRIYSSLDRRLQGLAVEALRAGIERVERRVPALHGDPTRPLQGCLLALRPRTGELLALVGGRDYGSSQFDRCVQARRQTGSVFKPFVYIAALEPNSGKPFITLASFLDDSPLEVKTPKGTWRPSNYDGTFHDTVSVREAMEHSYNVATARLALEVGLDRVTSVARRLGIESHLPQVPSLALGTADLSPLEVARAYATIASGGLRPRVQSVEDVVDGEGRVLERRNPQFERVLDAGTAYLATTLLQGVAARGTAAGVRAGGLSGPVAAKTGTTDEERDLWFVGFTPDLVAVVWLGFDEPRPVGVPSSAGALPIWRRFVEAVSGGEIRGAFPRPASVRRVAIDPRSGALARSGCPQSRNEYFLAGTLPTHECPETARKQQRGLGERFLRWLRGTG
ncbi:MAG: PBP1A family penicillin-binding protein [Myxococcales bacterium]|nr:PBP1A family penicillin-binding protein [Myxococcales bacterium]